MVYLEMSRDEGHGGGAWAFPNCVWAPTKKKKGGGTWPFWTKILDVRAGDLVLHLRGIPPNAFFAGYSTAATDGFETTARPPTADAWSYSPKFYRADLENFVPFYQPINLSYVFSARQEALEEYFDANKAKDSEKLNIFFVRQAGRLQCQNGAYLSDVDNGLLTALFGLALTPSVANGVTSPATVKTSWQLATVKTRLGQSLFSKSIKDLYHNECCFPACPITDPRFLVASHIARWSDNEHLRGNLGNGLCLCLMHDKAFELGIFTLDEKYRVFVNPKETAKASPVACELWAHHDEQIKLAGVLPLEYALLEHWIRVNLSP